MKVYEKIRAIREQKRWSQEDMAKQLSMSSAGYAKIERGETRLNLPRLEQIASVLETDICELMQGQDGSIVYQINEEGDNNNTIAYHNSDDKLNYEIDKLHLIIKYKDELLKQQQRELQIQQDLIAMLKQQLKLEQS